MDKSAPSVISSQGGGPPIHVVVGHDESLGLMSNLANEIFEFLKCGSRFMCLDHDI